MLIHMMKIIRIGIEIAKEYKVRYRFSFDPVEGSMDMVYIYGPCSASIYMREGEYLDGRVIRETLEKLAKKAIRKYEVYVNETRKKVRS